MNPKPPQFITFEGIEGSGKTTTIARAAEWLKNRGHHVRLLREPGGTALGDRIRAILLDASEAPLAPAAELLLFEVCRAQLVEEVIRPALAAGEVVLCDRYSDSTTAYQGGARGFDAALIRTLNGFASGGVEPDLTFLLDLPVEVGLARAKARGAPGEDRFEAESLEFHARVRAAFLAIAEAEPARVRVVDATADPDAVGWAVAEQLRARGL
ncbi:MAG: dTMP kinase [Myxococcales bacterium]|nr:dTMP kinase [Myxococcales bacterium]